MTALHAAAVCVIRMFRVCCAVLCCLPATCWLSVARAGGSVACGRHVWSAGDVFMMLQHWSADTTVAPAVCACQYAVHVRWLHALPLLPALRSLPLAGTAIHDHGRRRASQLDLARHMVATGQITRSWKYITLP